MAIDIGYSEHCSATCSVKFSAHLPHALTILNRERQPFTQCTVPVFIKRAFVC